MKNSAGLMIKWIVVFGLAFGLFVLMDSWWLGYQARGFYSEQVQEIAMLDDQGLVVFDVGIGLMAWIVIVGSVVMAVSLLYDAKRDYQWKAGLIGMMVGFALYATYDLTNMSFIPSWSWQLTLLDIAWGMVICGVNGLWVGWWMRKLKL